MANFEFSDISGDADNGGSAELPVLSPGDAESAAIVNPLGSAIEVNDGDRDPDAFVSDADGISILAETEADAGFGELVEHVKGPDAVNAADTEGELFDEGEPDKSAVDVTSARQQVDAAYDDPAPKTETDGVGTGDPTDGLTSTGENTNDDSSDCDKKANKGQQDDKYSQIRTRAVQLVYEYQKDHPLQIGDTVAVPGDPLAYEIREIREGDETAKVVGIVNAETGGVDTKVIPLSQLFNVNVANQIAKQLRISEALESLERVADWDQRSRNN